MTLKYKHCLTCDWHAPWLVWQGQTGYPWIDACMRQLRDEGWIHHVCRQSASCFLTRGDLWIDWQMGLEVRLCVTQTLPFLLLSLFLSLFPFPCTQKLPAIFFQYSSSHLSTPHSPACVPLPHTSFFDTIPDPPFHVPPSIPLPLIHTLFSFYHIPCEHPRPWCLTV